jgi:hypothetical protein
MQVSGLPPYVQHLPVISPSTEDQLADAISAVFGKAHKGIFSGLKNKVEQLPLQYRYRRICATLFVASLISQAVFGFSPLGIALSVSFFAAAHFFKRLEQMIPQEIRSGLALSRELFTNDNLVLFFPNGFPDEVAEAMTFYRVTVPAQITPLERQSFV